MCRSLVRSAFVAGWLFAIGGPTGDASAGDAGATWPPELKGANNGTVTLTTERFLDVPPEVEKTRGDDGAAAFVVAKEAPTVDLAFHRDLGPDAVNRRLWSSWGDIGLARNGWVYSAIGDHDDAVGGDARCFVYRWDPVRKVLDQVVDVNAIAPRKEGQPAWSKVHAKIDEGPDGAIYFSGTLNDGNRASQPEYRFGGDFPGGQLYRYDPETGKAGVFANLPPRRCTATSLVDHDHGIWWCNLEAGEGNALWGLDLRTREAVYHGKDGMVSFNRNFALGPKGAIYFNAENGIAKLDPQTKRVSPTGTSFPDESPGMRASTRPTKDGVIYGTTHRTNELFRFDTETGELKLLGPTWHTGQYTTVIELSSDERFLYYLPGSHGKAWTYGTPVVQYEIATGTRKVLAFLAPAFEEQFGYVPGGTYGMKLEEGTGGTLYVNFNGHAADAIRPEHMKPIGFGLCGFAAIHVPESER